MKTLFDSSKTVNSVAFGFGVDAADWDAMADEAMFVEAMANGVVGCSLEPLPAPAAPVTTTDREWSAADWQRADAFGLRTGNRRRPAPVAPAAPAPALTPKTENRPSAADRAEWARMTLEHAAPGSYFVEGEPRKHESRPTTRRAASRPRTYAEVRDAELTAARPVGQPFDSPEWDAYFALENRYERCYA